MLQEGTLFCVATRHLAVSDDGKDAIQKRAGQDAVVHAEEQLAKGTADESQNVVCLQLGAPKDIR